MIGDLEAAVVRACAGRWTRPEMEGWTVSTLVSLLAERLGHAATRTELERIIERGRAAPEDEL
jgi:hypothetical protein